MTHNEEATTPAAGPRDTTTVGRRYDPADAAHGLDAHTIDVWWLDYRREQRREPMRALIAGYLGCAPDAVVFTAGPHGKPYLARPQGTGLACNWSHSGTTAVVALAKDMACLGIDIEARSRRPRDGLALAQRFFSPREAAVLARLPAARREQAFIALWTAKEAALKAEGSGIAYGLAKVEFEWDEHDWLPRQFQGPIGAATGWQLSGWKLDSGCCHLAWRGPARAIRHFQPARDAGPSGAAELCLTPGVSNSEPTNGSS